MSEADIVRSITDCLRKRQGTWVLKVHGGPMQQRGIPDLPIVSNGRLYALEVKTDVGKVSAIQRHEMRRLAEAGAVVAVVRSLADVKEMLRDHG